MKGTKTYKVDAASAQCNEVGYHLFYFGSINYSFYRIAVNHVFALFFDVLYMQIYGILLKIGIFPFFFLLFSIKQYHFFRDIVLLLPICVIFLKNFFVFKILIFSQLLILCKKSPKIFFVKVL
mgnify:CR=1 FL=1